MARRSRASAAPLWTALLGCCIVSTTVAQQGGVFRAGTVTLTQQSFFDAPKRYAHFIQELIDLLNQRAWPDYHVGDSCNGGTIFGSEATSHFSMPDSVVPIITPNGFTISVSLPMSATIPVSGHVGWKWCAWGCHCWFGSGCGGNVVLTGKVGATMAFNVAATPDGTVSVQSDPPSIQPPQVEASGVDCHGWMGGVVTVLGWFGDDVVHDVIQEAMNDFVSKLAARLSDQWSTIPAYSPYPDIYVQLLAVNTVFAEQSFVRVDFNASVWATSQLTGNNETIIPKDAVAAATLPPPIPPTGTEPPVNDTASTFLNGARFSSTLLTVLLDAADRSGATNKTMTTTVMDAKLLSHLRYAEPLISVPVDDSLSFYIDWGVVDTRCMSSGPDCGALMLEANFSHLHGVGHIVYQESPTMPAQLNIVVDSFDTKHLIPVLNAPKLGLPSSFVDNVVNNVVNGLKPEISSLAFRLPDYAVPYFPNPKVGIKNQAGCCGGDHGYIEVTLNCDCTSVAGSPWERCNFSPCHPRSSATLRGTKFMHGVDAVDIVDRGEVELSATSAGLLQGPTVAVEQQADLEDSVSDVGATSDLIMLTFPTSDSCDLAVPGQEAQTSYLVVDGAGTCTMQLPLPAGGLNASATYYKVQANANSTVTVWHSCAAGCQEASCAVIVRHAALNQCYAVSGAPNLSAMLTPAASPCIGWAHQTSNFSVPGAMILETATGAHQSPTCDMVKGASVTISNAGPVGACTDASAGSLVPGSLETVVVPNASQPSVLQLYSDCRFNCAAENCTTSLGPLTQGTCVPHQDGSFYMANRVRPLSELPLCSPPVLPPYTPPPPPPPPVPYELPHWLIPLVACVVAVLVCGVCVAVKREAVGGIWYTVCEVVDEALEIVVDYGKAVWSRVGVWPKYYVNNGEASIVLSSVALALSSAAFYGLGAAWHNNSPFTSFTHGNLTRLGDLAQDVNATVLSAELRSWSSHGHDWSWIVATCLAVISAAPTFMRLSAKAWHRAFVVAVLAAFLSLWGMITLPGFTFSVGQSVEVESVSTSGSSTLFGKTNITALVTTGVRRSISASVCLIVGHMQLFFLHALYPGIVVATVLFSIANRKNMPYNAVHVAWAIQCVIIVMAPVGCLLPVLISYHAQTTGAEPIQEWWLIMWGVYWFGCVVFWMLLRWSLLPDWGVRVLSDCRIFSGLAVAVLYVSGFIQVCSWLLFGEHAVTAVPLEFTAALLVAALFTVMSAGWVALQYWRWKGHADEADESEFDLLAARPDDSDDGDDDDDDDDDPGCFRLCSTLVTKYVPPGVRRVVAWLFELEERRNPAVYGVRIPGRRLCGLVGSCFFGVVVHHFWVTNVEVSARDQFAAFVATLGSQLIWPSGKTLLDGAFKMYHSAVTQEFYTMLVAVVPIGIACMLVDLCCMQRRGLRVARLLQFIGVPILLGSAIVITIPPFASVIPVKQIVHPCAPNFDSAVEIIAGTLVGFIEDVFIIDAVAPLVLLVPGELIRSAVVLMAAGVSDAFRAVLSFMMVAAATLVPLLFGFLALAWFQILGDGVDGCILAALLVFLVLPLVGAAVLVRVLWRRPSAWWLYPVWLVVCYLCPFCVAVYYTALRLEMLERLMQHLQSFWTWAPLIAQVCIGVVFVSDQLITTFNQIVTIEAKERDGRGEYRPLAASVDYGAGFGSDLHDRSPVVGAAAPGAGDGRRLYTWSFDGDGGDAADSPRGHYEEGDSRCVVS